MTRTVTRADLVEAAYREIADVSRPEIKQIAAELFATIGDALIAGKIVKISRFAVFVPHRVEARIGRNPKRPDEVHAIPAHVNVAFRAADELKHHVRTGKPE